MGIKEILKNNETLFAAYKKLAKVKGNFLASIAGIAPEYVSKVRYQDTFNRKLDLKNPVYFNEKLMWLKLKRYANDPLAIQGADKYMVREYVKDCGLEHTLNELLGVWDDARDIDWDKLPNRFAMKCNHACGYNLICTDKSKLDIKASVKMLNKWLKKGTWREYAEIHYKKIEPKIIAEAFLEGKDGGLPVDYKFYCFNGEPLFIGNFIERNLEEHSIVRGYFNPDWTPSDVFAEKDQMDLSKFEKPDNLETMMEYSRILSKAFPFVRVDFYDVDGKIIFGELTFTPTGCLGAYYAKDAYKKLGDALDIGR